MDVIDLFPFGAEIGYLGLAVVSFLGSLVPFLPVPSFLLLVTMAVGDTFNLHILVLLSAACATGAKQIIFYASYGGRKMMSEEARRRMRPFERLVKRYGAAAVFVAAATPMPDDLVYVPLGLARYNPRRFFIATFTGKIVLHYIIVLISHYLGASILEAYFANNTDPTPVYIGVAVFAAALTVIVVLMLRLDWGKILGKRLPWTLEDDESK
ncbi:uncharacterized membrane-associated protein [Cenarchaeum symbiosum A]|uniref:Uncharacterized membrane-associated protein n=1 Tax=Cenarchaeum symbiosum (strain A) TaxID=414004 RepID=A0RV66_CENSY|nr:uncharacterized membrane-associated protein [Cenarchaeum symbiosum A]